MEQREAVIDTVRRHPAVPGLADSVTRVAPLQRRTEFRPDLPGDGEWQRCADLLADPARFAAWRRALAGWLRARFGEAPGRTTAGYVMSWYLHVPAYTAALLLHHERRVPLLRPEELAFRLGGDRPHPEGIAVLGSEFYCLPADPAAGCPDATVVRDERALAAALRARYTGHAARFVAAYAPVSRLGRRMLWAAATDALDNALWWAGRQGGDEGAGVADAALVLDARYPPLTAASALRLEGRCWTRRRESCCFSYLLPGEAECAECPRLRAK
ncbi:Ferric iron reductase protein FhuF, involved in iron transport [Amycolatopsis sacchari]|uniref:Ferric iron reductase protein FhuF, involved in iron transport n=1 Tax=Amycolatopsis sacchari TaxID=115433 RepID=A0A1I4AY84_9PSEU|nr:(2Fe-2S)-binding protein [Amycolatopsis sacchari]SFK60649.1 Ferric iron reductase protein FhuF, involved in iron transport [Amycolatopsis sacchari]